MKNKFINWMVISCMMVLGCTSCHRDGTMNPPRKIARIYTITEDGPKTVAEWVWKGNRLSKLSTLYRTYEYEYKNGQIHAITFSKSYNQDTICYYFHYDKSGKYLERIEAYAKNNIPDFQWIPYEHWDFTHNDRHQISGYTREFFHSTLSKSSCEQADILALLTGNVSFNTIFPSKNETQGKEYHKEIVSFKYEGDNIVEIRKIRTNSDVEEVSQYYYVDYANPFLPTITNHYHYFLPIGNSQNLVSESYHTRIYPDHFPQARPLYYHFEYEMIDGCPEKITMHSEYLNNWDKANKNSEKSTTVYYCEYVK
ncbi:MAG: hypothetical protein IKZ56_12805 [Bacteroidales bacterium]|nr:hypothetical protein [Bacteroidales bacterium]MBR5922030.1 hypothetical protein [Bacteroidales bacterium]